MEAADMAEELTAVKEEEPLEDGTLIAEEAPVTESNLPDAVEGDEQQIVAAGTIIAQAEEEAEAPEDMMNVKEETQAEAGNDYQEDSESSKEEDCPIVEVGTIIAQGNQDDAEAAEAPEAASRTADEQDSRRKRGHSPESYDNSKRLRQRWEEDDSARPHGSDYRKDQHKVLNLQRQWLKTPEEVNKVLRKEEWRSNSAGGCFDFTEMNFSQTKMTNDGLREVVKFCKKCPDLRVLKLYQNQLDDEGCRELAGLFRDCPGLEELHLSHNWLTEKGVEMLATAALDNLSSRFSRPFWLRVEHNNFSHAKSCIEDLKHRFHPKICGREDKWACSNRECVKNCRMHIPFLVDDKGNRGSRGNWGRQNEDWSYEPKYKAMQRSRSRSPPPQPIRLKERELSPPTRPKPRAPRDFSPDRMDRMDRTDRMDRMDRDRMDRRAVYYQHNQDAYPAYRRMRNEAPMYPQRWPTPPVRRPPVRPQSPPRIPHWAPRRNRQTPMEPKMKQQQQTMAPVRRPPSPPLPKPKSQQAQYALPAPLQAQAPVDDGESEYSYDYYSDDYSYDEDEAPAHPGPVAGNVGHVAHPHPPFGVPKMKMSRDSHAALAAPPIPLAPKARPPPRQPPAPRGAPRARARMPEQHLVNRYEALRDPRDPRDLREPLRDRPVRPARRRAA